MLFDKGAFLQHFMRNVLKTSVITSHTTLPNALSKKNIYYFKTNQSYIQKLNRTFKFPSVCAHSAILCILYI